MDEIGVIAQLRALLGPVLSAASSVIAVLLLVGAGEPWGPAEIAGSSRPWLTTSRMGQREGLLVGERETYCDAGAQAEV